MEIVGEMGIGEGGVGLVPVKPVLDRFADDEEVAIDEALDDLTVPLLSCTQLAGCRHRLAKRGKAKMLTVCNEFTTKCFVPLLIPPLTVSRRLMAWPLLGLPKPAGGALSSATFSFFQRFPPSRASA